MSFFVPSAGLRRRRFKKRDARPLDLPILMPAPAKKLGQAGIENPFAGRFAGKKRLPTKIACCLPLGIRAGCQ
jgi:hypothetical protein